MRTPAESPGKFAFRNWLGAMSDELWSYDGTRFANYGQADGLPEAAIGALHVTAKGDMWIGTLGGGFWVVSNTVALFLRRFGTGCLMMSSLGLWRMVWVTSG